LLNFSICVINVRITSVSLSVNQSITCLNVRGQLCSHTERRSVPNVVWAYTVSKIKLPVTSAQCDEWHFVNFCGLFAIIKVISNNISFIFYEYVCTNMSNAICGLL